MYRIILFYNFQSFYPTALGGCRGIVFTHGVRMGGRSGGIAGSGKSLFGLYFRNRKVNYGLQSSYLVGTLVGGVGVQHHAVTLI